MAKTFWTGIFSVIGMLMMILDSKTGIYGASEGLRVCIQVLIPSLFPFIFLSILITGYLSGKRINVLQPLCCLCGIPQGAECLFLTGILGGYPSGAQVISYAWEKGCISKEQARRMLGFCNNAGPSFLFGIIASQFSSKSTVWVLWLIHIISAILTGILLPEKKIATAGKISSSQITIPKAAEKAMRSMAQICSWVILCKVMLCFLERWVFWLFPKSLQIILTGIMELANGCWQISGISNEGLRFIICSGLLSFGGFCVLLQTISATGKLGLGMYLPGKIIQTTISIFLAYAFQNVLFHNSERWAMPLFAVVGIIIFILLFILFHHNKKITVAIREKLMYNPVITR